MHLFVRRTLVCRVEKSLIKCLQMLSKDVTNIDVRRSGCLNYFLIRTIMFTGNIRRPFPRNFNMTKVCTVT